MNNFSIPYFRHDTHARNNPLLVLVQMQYGLRGLGFWWCLVEILYEQRNKVSVNECASIAYALHEQSEWVAEAMRFFESINLLQYDEKSQNFSSRAVESRMNESYEKWKKKSEQARKAAYSRHKKGVLHEHSERNADALHEQCETMPIRLDKIREDNKREREDFSFLLPIFTELGVVGFYDDFRKAAKRQKQIYNMEAYARTYIKNRIARESTASKQETDTGTNVADAIAAVKAKRAKE